MLTRYLLVLVAFAVLDAAWLLGAGARFNQAQFGPLLRPDTQWAPAVLFYLIYGAAVLLLAVEPARATGRVRDAAWRGALLGLASYGAFDLTGLALFARWPTLGAAVDMAWGTFASAAVSTIAARVARPAHDVRPRA